MEVEPVDEQADQDVCKQEEVSSVMVWMNMVFFACT